MYPCEEGLEAAFSHLARCGEQGLPCRLTYDRAAYFLISCRSGAGCQWHRTEYCAAVSSANCIFIQQYHDAQAIHWRHRANDSLTIRSLQNHIAILHVRAGAPAWRVRVGGHHRQHHACCRPACSRQPGQCIRISSAAAGAGAGAAAEGARRAAGPEEAAQAPTDAAGTHCGTDVGFLQSSEYHLILCGFIFSQRADMFAARYPQSRRSIGLNR